MSIHKDIIFVFLAVIIFALCGYPYERKLEAFLLMATTPMNIKSEHIFPSDYSSIRSPDQQNLCFFDAHFEE